MRVADICIPNYNQRCLISNRVYKHQFYKWFLKEVFWTCWEHITSKNSTLESRISRDIHKKTFLQSFAGHQDYWRAKFDIWTTLQKRPTICSKFLRHIEEYKRPEKTDKTIEKKKLIVEALQAYKDRIYRGKTSNNQCKEEKMKTLLRRWMKD